MEFTEKSGNSSVQNKNKNKLRKTKKGSKNTVKFKFSR